jgi:hypothetical protein
MSFAKILARGISDIRQSFEVLLALDNHVTVTNRQNPIRCDCAGLSVTKSPFVEPALDESCVTGTLGGSIDRRQPRPRPPKNLCTQRAGASIAP